MSLTKHDMARVIVQALYNMPALPDVNHPEVITRARHGTVESLTRQHGMACRALDSVKAEAASSRALDRVEAESPKQACAEPPVA